MNNDDIKNLSKLLDVLYALANPSRSNPHDLEIAQAFNAAMKEHDINYAKLVTLKSLMNRKAAILETHNE
jgi:hypothetical protein